MKRIALIALIALIILPALTYANPVVLKCVTSEGRKASDLIIDIEKKEMTWGEAVLDSAGNSIASARRYDIIHVDDLYISAYERKNYSSGGEIWVIDRRNGEYKRASIALIWYDEKMSGPGKLEAHIYTGHCVKQLF